MTRDHDHLSWRYVFVCALVWALGATLADELVQPIADLAPGQIAAFVSRAAAQWVLAGFIWAAGVKLAEETGRPLLFLPLVLGLAWSFSLLVHRLIFSRVAAGGGGMDTLVMHIPLADMAAYMLWGNLFYGGLYSFGYLATRRTLRLRRRLAELSLARNLADTRLREARLQAVRGQIQPAMLLDALSALQSRYADDIDAGNRLFDQIIDFLRAAMPGLRSGASTISAELGVLSAYAKLLDGLDAGTANWRLDLAEGPAEFPFPPLRLLPVLDQISRAAPSGSTIEVTAQQRSGDYILSIGAKPPLPNETAGKLQAVIQRSLGSSPVGAVEAIPGLIAQLRFRTGSLQSVPSLA